MPCCWASSSPGIREKKKRDCFLGEEEEEGFEVGRQKKRKNKKKRGGVESKEGVRRRGKGVCGVCRRTRRTRRINHI
jgi:hypothetical protein